MSVEYVHTLTKLWKLSIILQVYLEGTKWLMVVDQWMIIYREEII